MPLTALVCWYTIWVVVAAVVLYKIVARLRPSYFLPNWGEPEPPKIPSENVGNKVSGYYRYPTWFAVHVSKVTLILRHLWQTKFQGKLTDILFRQRILAVATLLPITVRRAVESYFCGSRINIIDIFAFSRVAGFAGVTT
ncbi:hypothetical protein BH11PSE12_BH11PSE12_06250 [soil metagenome]